jgi:hypothetical protein
MLFGKLCKAALLSAVAVQDVAALTMKGKPHMMIKKDSDGLQDIVTWDEVSLPKTHVQTRT